MKLLHVTFRFEFADAVTRIFDDREVSDYVRHPRTEGRDREGRHFGSQVFPGNMACIQALVSDDAVKGLLEDLKAFKEAKTPHQHLRAAVMEVGQEL